MTNAGARIWLDKALPILYRGSMYASRFPIGVSEGIENATVQQLKDFYKTWYRPDNMAIVFVGNIDIESFKEYIKTYLASIKPAQSYNITNKEFFRPKPAKKEIHMGNGDKSSVSLGWYVKENYSQSLSAKTCVFEEYMNIILTDHLRMKLGEIYYIAPVCLADMFLGELTMGGNFSCDPKNSKRLINVVISDINNMAQSNIEKNILDKAKKACKTGWEKSIQDNFVIARGYVYMSVFNKDDFNVRPLYYDKVTPED
ncbi:MAG: insulinase family protein [Endomicrobium sp.]|jgi:predicted Zn-dependent peptidase|nr:insulinase family protein [Endomicrobium sp.]